MTITQRIIGGLRTPSAPVVLASGTRSMPANPSARYFAFPVATALSDGRILVAFQDNANHFGGYGSGGRFALIDATGTTWGDSTVLVTEPNSDTRWWAPVGIARRGSRLAILQTVNDSPRRGFIQVTTDPTTWPAPTVEVTWAQAGVMPCHLAWIEDGTTNGRMLATAYSGSGVVISASGDNGATWEHWSQVTTGGDGFSESTITVTARGDLLMLQRKDAAPDADTIHARWSSDHGKTWSAPVPVIRAASGMPTCTLLPDGRLVATIRDKGRPVYEPWSLAWSSDHGAMWQVTPVTDDWMMYGQIVTKTDGKPLLVGGSQRRDSSTLADVWARTITEITPTL